jgi:hypothetical protein
MYNPCELIGFEWEAGRENSCAKTLPERASSHSGNRKIDAGRNVNDSTDAPSESRRRPRLHNGFGKGPRSQLTKIPIVSKNHLLLPDGSFTATYVTKSEPYPLG